MIVKNRFTTVASLLLTTFFVCIIIFVMLEVLEIQDSDTGIRPLVFTIIDFIMVYIIIGFGKSIANAVGGGMYPSICGTTVVYSVINIAFNCLERDMDSTAIFTLINLVMLFVYFCIVIPLAVAGSGQEEEKRIDPNRTNNIDNNQYNIRR